MTAGEALDLLLAAATECRAPDGSGYGPCRVWRYDRCDKGAAIAANPEHCIHVLMGSSWVEYRTTGMCMDRWLAHGSKVDAGTFCDAVTVLRDLRFRDACAYTRAVNRMRAWAKSMAVLEGRT